MTSIQGQLFLEDNSSFLHCNDPPAQTSRLTPKPVEIPGPNCDTIIKSLGVLPIPFAIAKSLIVRHHYLHSIPGGTMLSFGIFLGTRLLGTATLGAGPYLAYHLVAGAKPDDCLTLTRFWLSDWLPRNSESHSLGLILKAMRDNKTVKFLVSYADPALGHIGIIYQATGWLYTGLSSATPLYDIGDGVLRHSRSLAHEMGSHSLNYWRSHGVNAKAVPQSAKHRYVYLLDRSWLTRLNVPVLKYPKKQSKENENENC